MKIYINYDKINNTIKDAKEEEIKKEIIKNIKLKTKKFVLKQVKKNGSNI